MKKRKKSKLQFNPERHREVKLMRAITVALHIAESKGLLWSRTDPITGETKWGITEMGRNEPD
jgi:hypothetical protein